MDSVLVSGGRLWYGLAPQWGWVDGTTAAMLGAAHGGAKSDVVTRALRMKIIAGPGSIVVASVIGRNRNNVQIVQHAIMCSYPLDDPEGHAECARD